MGIDVRKLDDAAATTELPKLGVLAGGGALPRRLIAAARAQGREVFVIAFHGQTDTATAEAAPSLWTHLGHAGEALERLRGEKVEELVLAGPIRRPSLLKLRLDARAAKFVAQVGRRAFGDDGLLGAVVRALEEEEGFRVIAVQDILGDLLIAAGVYGRHRPDAQADADIARGLEIVQALGRLDVGQAAVVQQGLVLGVEAIEGTDALLRRAAELRRDGPGGVLIKTAKPGQETRVDLPTIGLETVERAKSAGLRGLAVQAGATLVVERQGVVAACDEAALFLIGLDLDHRQ
ncbi:LpxI family protein [Algihabitans albus]|uniref:LpxI family protein n=1 Tax=Algihabitans albus TaxID=2164067 RepID=UPI000E5D2DAC|nr:UDP-2,3-diacylglucosamine diphosphatase LpxI [Algihabitans albus]